jgi:6-pyruvoyl-tetrahydropterin synthase
MVKHTEFTTVINLESAHSVLEQKERFEKIHGHAWTVTAHWTADFPLDQNVFQHHLSYLEKAVSDLNHENLNNIEGMKKNIATAEAVVELIFKRLSAFKTGSELISVEVEEEPGCIISYFKK